jgi:hypothetical protein
MMQQQIVMFPSEYGISEMRGIVKMVKDNNREHTMRVSELLRHSHKRFDELDKIIRSCRMLGFITISNGSIRLTKSGARLQIGNFQSVLRGYLTKIEPFKTVNEALRHREHMSTKELSQFLRHRGVAFVTDERQNEEMLRHMLFRWGVRSGLFEYSVHSDRWRTAQ